MTPVVCVIDRNYFPFLVLGTSLLTILIFSKFKFHNVIRSQVEHLIWYLKIILTIICLFPKEIVLADYCH